VVHQPCPPPSGPLRWGGPSASAAAATFPSLDLLISSEIASVDNLLNLLAAPAPAAAVAQLQRPTLAQSAAVQVVQGLCAGPHAGGGGVGMPLERELRERCEKLEAAQHDSHQEVERLTRRRLVLEKALSNTRDEVGVLRSAQAALEAEGASKERHEGALRQQALALRLDLQRSREEMERREVRHAREIGELQQEVFELRARLVTFHSDHAAGASIASPPRGYGCWTHAGVGRPSLGGCAAGPPSLEGALLEVCALLKEGVEALPDPAQLSLGLMVSSEEPVAVHAASGQRWPAASPEHPWNHSRDEGAWRT